MKIKTIQTNAFNLKTMEFVSDELFDFYDFRTDEHGSTIFSQEFIYNLLNKKLKDSKDIKKAEEFIEFIKPLNFGKRNYNFIISLKDGQVVCEIGYRCKEIKNNIEEYNEYLNELKNKGVDVRIEFEIENEN